MLLHEIERQRRPVDDESCLGKRTYSSPAEAHAVAARMRGAKRKAIAPFRCPYCRKWHVGRHL